MYCHLGYRRFPPLFGTQPLVSELTFPASLCYRADVPPGSLRNSRHPLGAHSVLRHCRRSVTFWNLSRVFPFLACSFSSCCCTFLDFGEVSLRLPNPSVPAVLSLLRAVSPHLQPSVSSHQMGVGGPWQSCWWSLPWAPQSPARSLQSRTAWRVPEWPARSEPRSELRSRGARKTECKHPESSLESGAENRGQLPGRSLPGCSSRCWSSGSWAGCVFQFPFRLQD